MNQFPTPLLERLLSEPAFLSPGALLAAVASAVETEAAEPAYFKQMRDALKPRADIGADGIASIEISGKLASRPHPYLVAFSGFEDTAAAAEVFAHAAADPNVRGIFLSWDSPGGFVTGGPEFGSLIAEVAKTKPVVSWTGGTMASLAYWIASQSSAVYASESALVGSIGCYNIVPDYSKAYADAGIKVEVFRNKEAVFKAAGIPGTSLTDEQRKHLAESSQRWFDLFKADVMRARPQVKADAMRGQVLSGSEAAASGLVDGIARKASARGFLAEVLRQRQNPT